MNITLLIHGPAKDNILDKILLSLKTSRMFISKIVFVCYANELKYIETIKNQFSKYEFDIVLIKDLINPGFANINRQIISVSAGLNLVDDNDFVIKLRNDQCVDFNLLKKEIDMSNIDFFKDKKIITTNCYSRKDRYYHPSDMFLCAKASLLKDYYNIPLSVKTELEVKFDIIERMENGEKFKYSPFSPESYLFRNFLKNNGWVFKENYDDSIKALRKYFYIINSWNINFIWKKKRVYPFNAENKLILPHYFKMAPFDGGPIEDVSCLVSHDISGRKTLKDMYYLLKSKAVWKNWDCNLLGNRFLRKQLKEKIKKHYKKFINPLYLLFALINKFIKWILEIFSIVYYILRYIYYKLWGK